jgi:centromeric protein E
VTKECTLGEEPASWKRNGTMNLMLSRKNAMSWRFLKVYRERYDTLERECWLLKEERDSSLEKVPESSKKLAVVVDQKEKHFEGFEH